MNGTNTANLAAYLNGRGVPNMDDAMKEIFLQPIHQAYRELVNAGYFRWVISNRLVNCPSLGRSGPYQLVSLLRSSGSSGQN